MRQQYITGIAWTTFAAVIGLSISIVLGIALAVVMAQARWMERSMYPYLVAAQALPVLAIVPLINSVFGGGMGARIFVCVMISIFPIVTNTLFGLTSVDTSMHELFTLRGVSRRTRLTKLQFPAALPSIFVGFRIAAGLSVIGAIVGEQFFRSGQKPGIGVVAELFRQKSRFPQLYGALIVAVAARHHRVLLLRRAAQARHRPLGTTNPARAEPSPGFPSTGVLRTPRFQPA